jgi:hypothetical protein
MEKLVQWMTLPELRDELERTRQAWEAEIDLDGLPADGQHPALSEDAHRHQVVQPGPAVALIPIRT